MARKRTDRSGHLAGCVRGEPAVSENRVIGGSSPRRVGARRPDLVPAHVLKYLLNGGESANHMEQIAVDRAALFAAHFPELASSAPRLQKLSLVASMREGGSILAGLLGPDAWELAYRSTSDIVRGWGAMALAAADIVPEKRLELLRPFADDDHFAVREWAWLAFRSDVVREPPTMIDLLLPWTHRPSDRLRRFASEVTRPCGVWSRHVQALKETPELAEPLLHALRADSSRYVQRSVGNWLNDAARTRPDWVLTTIARWGVTGSSASTWICRRGARSLTDSPGI